MLPKVEQAARESLKHFLKTFELLISAGGGHIE